jgi:acyl carrier protein
VWAQVLDRDDVGPDENFFDLGGNSLLMARASARLSEVLGRELPVVVLTMYPSVSALAAHLSGSEDSPAPATGPAADRIDRGKDRLLRQRGLRRRTATKESD